MSNCMEEEEMKVKMIIFHTPDEFREMLVKTVPHLADVFDSLVKSLVESSAYTEKEAKTIIAVEMFNSIQNMLKAKKK